MYIHIHTYSFQWLAHNKANAFFHNQPGNYDECVLGSLQHNFFISVFLPHFFVMALFAKPLGLGLDNRFWGPTLFLLIEDFIDFMTSEDK